MLEKTFSLSYLFIFSVILIIFWLVNCSISIASASNNFNGSDIGNQYNNSLTIAESDLLSGYTYYPNLTENFTLILYHEAWIINNDNVPKNVTIFTSIPKVDYKQLKIRNITIFPVFGENALMTGNLIRFYFNPNNLSVLGSPTIQIGDSQINYTWNNVEIAPLSAIEIAYNNYYGDGSEIYNNTIINLPSASIARSYYNNDSQFIMNYTLTNTGALRLDGTEFQVFFPEEIDGKPFIQISNVTTSSLLTPENNTHYVDGTGHASIGYMIGSTGPNQINSSNSINYFINVKGNINRSGKVYPSLIINYISDGDFYNQTGKMARLWTPIQIMPSEPTNISKFYYYYVSLYIPENNYFIVKPNINNITSSPGDTTSATPIPAISILITVLIIGIVSYCIGNKK